MVSKPTHDELPPVAQEAKLMFEGMVAKHVAQNPEMAKEEKMAAALGNIDLSSLKAVQHQSEQREVASQAVAGVQKNQSPGIG